MPIEVPFSDDGPIEDSGSGISGGAGNAGSSGGTSGNEVPVGVTGDPGVVLPPIVQEIVAALIQPEKPPPFDIADVFGFNELATDFVFDAIDKIEGITEDVARSIQTAKTHETELVQAVVNTTKSAADALHLLFAGIPDDISEEDAQTLLADDGIVLISNGSPTGDSAPQQQVGSCSECMESYLAGVNPDSVGNVWGAYYYAAWQACHHLCPELSHTYEEAPPTPSTNPSVIIFFGGSDGVKLSNVGPNPANQTPVWVQIPGFEVHVYQYPGVPRADDPNTWFNTAHYDPQDLTTWIIGSQYDPNAPVGKSGQAGLAEGYENSDILVIGYSAGADTAVIFADQYMKQQQSSGDSGRIVGLAVLGGTMTGTMPDGVSSLENEWPRIFDELLNTGAEVYVLDDKAADGGDAKTYSNETATGLFWFDEQLNQEHWDGSLSGQVGIGTNNSQECRDALLQWFETNR